MTTQDTERRLALVKSATSGVLDDLECPSCRRKSVTVRFTHPFGSEYRTWFLCRSCDFTMRAQNSGVPAHFSQGRVDRDLQTRDRDGVANHYAALTPSFNSTREFLCALSYPLWMLAIFLRLDASLTSRVLLAAASFPVVMLANVLIRPTALVLAFLYGLPLALLILA